MARLTAMIPSMPPGTAAPVKQAQFSGSQRNGRFGPALRDVRDWAIYVAARLVAVAMHAFPVNVNLQTAKLLGTGMYLIDKRHRERALGNLRRSFPELSEKQRQR